MISRELLSKVLDKRCSKVGMFGTTYIEYTWSSPPNYVDSRINIYELEHKCKKWVLKDTGYSMCSGLARSVHSTEKNKIGDGMCQVGANFFFADTEPEAVFKACEYIVKF